MPSQTQPQTSTQTLKIDHKYDCKQIMDDIGSWRWEKSYDEIDIHVNCRHAMSVWLVKILLAARDVISVDVQASNRHHRR